MKLREALQAKLLREERDTDRLTGLLNKAALEERIHTLLAEPRETGALVILDIDNFKHINDTYGHAFGDMVIRHTALCIQKTVREEDLCGRFGGDEFLLFLPGVSEEELAQKLDGLLVRLREEVTFPDGSGGFGTSIGAAVVQRSGKDYRELFHSADAALYQAKTAGKNCFRVAAGMPENDREQPGKN